MYSPHKESVVYRFDDLFVLAWRIFKQKEQDSNDMKRYDAHVPSF